MNRWQTLGYHFRWGWLLIWLVMLSIWVGKFIEPSVDHTIAGDRWFLPHNFFRYPLWWTVGDTPLDYEGFIGFLGAYHGDTFFIGWGFVIALIFMHVPMIADVLQPSRRHLLRQKLTPYTALCISLMSAFVTMSIITIGLDLHGSWFTFVTYRGPFAPMFTSPAGTGWVNPAWSVPGLATLAVLWLLCFAILQLRQPQTVRYWQIERLTRWLVITSFVVMCIAMYVGSDMARPWRQSLWNANSIRLALRSSGPSQQGVVTAFMLSGTTMLWAVGYRTLLLFQLRWMTANRGAMHECLACGYDLTGTVMATRKSCPECGEIISENQSTHIAKQQTVQPS